MASATSKSGQDSGSSKQAQYASKTKPPRRVLVVEDDAVLAMAIEDALQDHGVTDIVLCSTTKQALAALSDKKPDAIILDVHLADTDDGWAIAELVTQVSPRAPRIIFSTGAPQDIPEHIAELGVVLAKPYSPGDLIAALHKPRGKGLLGRLKQAFD